MKNALAVVVALSFLSAGPAFAQDEKPDETAPTKAPKVDGKETGKDKKAPATTKKGEHPKGEHSKGEHSKGEHPKGEHSKGEHSKGEKPMDEHPK